MKCSETVNINLLQLEQRTGTLETKGGSEFGKRILYTGEKFVCFLFLELQLRVLYGCQGQSDTTVALFRSTCTGSWHCRSRTCARLTKERLEWPLLWVITCIFSLYHWPVNSSTDTIFKLALSPDQQPLALYLALHGHLFLSSLEDISSTMGSLGAGSGLARDIINTISACTTS